MMFRFVESFELNLSRTGRVLASASIDHRRVVFVENTDTGEIYLPVVPGRGFEVVVSNDTPAIVAFPARIGNGTDWTNVYRGCPVIDPALMPSEGGMWETRPGHRQVIDGFQLPHGRQEPFVIAASGATVGQDDNLNTIEVYYRPPVNPVAQINEPAPILPFGAVARGSRSAGSIESDVTVASGPVQQGARIITGLGYQPTATRLVQARLVSRAWMAMELFAHGINLLPRDNVDWEPGSIKRNYGDLYTQSLPVAS